MASFIHENFLLHNKTGQQLYHEYAAAMPIIDYHNHLIPELIASDHQFENLTQIWLYGDHYKWRAMRTNGVDESYCTGTGKSDLEKFLKWAATVPYTVRNPLYHWTHLELKRYFGIDLLLSPDSAAEIYDTASNLLRTPDYSVRNLLRKMQVKTLCTTDDPIDHLDFHKKIRDDQFEVIVKPAFRPDKAMAAENPVAFNAYVARVQEVSGIEIHSLANYLDALKKRHDFFQTQGCTVSDHGLEFIHASDFTEAAAAQAFNKVRTGASLEPAELELFKSFMLYTFAIWDHEKGWVQQYHLGALRNNNSRMMRQLGPDTGWDSIGDFQQGRALATFLDRLDNSNQLAKTILYNLNPSDNELMATMIGNFNDGSVAGKIQFGSGWWFLDQKDGMVKQLNALSNMGLLSKFIGMLTDSRSFMSFPRHEYFRRLLCDLLGDEIEKGELPNDIPWIGKIVQDICYNNAQKYFGF